jgi:hypothetical protein
VERAERLDAALERSLGRVDDQNVGGIREIARWRIMRNSVVIIMFAVAVVFLMNHAVMVMLSVESWPIQIDEQRQTPDIQVRQSSLSLTDGQTR